MERGAGGSAASPARATGGGMCGRFLTFLANGLSIDRQKSITEGPRNSGRGGGGYHELEQEEDEFAIRIERAEFVFNDHGDEGHDQDMTVLEDTSTAAATASDEQQYQKRDAADAAAERDTVAGTASDDQQQQKRAATDAAADRPVAAATAVEETKTTRKTATIKEDRPEDATTAGDGSKVAPALEGKKKPPFRKRKASTSSGGAGELEQGGRGPRRSGLRPRTLAVLRVPSDINEKSSTFIDERRKSFGGKAALAADK